MSYSSSALAMEIPQPCVKPLIWWISAIMKKNKNKKEYDIVQHRIMMPLFHAIHCFSEIMNRTRIHKDSNWSICYEYIFQLPMPVLSAPRPPLNMPRMMKTSRRKRRSQWSVVVPQVIPQLRGPSGRQLVGHPVVGRRKRSGVRRRRSLGVNLVGDMVAAGDLGGHQSKLPNTVCTLS